MAKRSVGGAGRIVFGVLGLGLATLTIAIWLHYLVNPARAILQGSKATVTVTRCEGSGLDRTCFGRWPGGSGKLDGHPAPGSRVQAYISDGKAYQTALKDWYSRLVLGLVGLAAAVVAQYLLRTALRGPK
jgi:hypothetical protein